MPETRKHERMPISLRVRFRSATLDDFVEQYAHNISHGGLFIRSRAPMPIGTLIKFEFRLTDESSVITGVGRVVWVRGEANDEIPAGMGIKFIKVDPESRERIVDIVDRRGGGAGTFEAEEAAQISDPPPAPNPPKGLASGSAPPAEKGVARHPQLQGLASDDVIRAPQKSDARVEAKPPRETLSSLASALMSTSDEATSDRAPVRAESLPVGLGPDADPFSVDGDGGLPPLESGPLSDIPEESDPFERPTSKSDGVSAIESALADSLDSMPVPAQDATARYDASQAKDLLANNPTDTNFGLGVDDVADIGASSQAATASPELPAADPVKAPVSSPPQESRSRLLAGLFALLVIMVMVMGYLWMEQGKQTSTTDPASVDGNATTAENAALPAATAAAADAGAADSGAADAGAADAREPASDAAPSPAVETVKTTFRSNVKGAVFSYGGRSSDSLLELPKDTEVTVVAKAAGFADAQKTFRPNPRAKVQRIVLKSLPHVVLVRSTPPGAVVTISGKRATTPGEISFARRPGRVAISGSLKGYLPNRAKLNPDAFVQKDARMEQTVTLTLAPRPVAQRAKPATRPAPTKPAPAKAPATKPKPDVEKPKPVKPKPTEPKPVTTKKPTETAPVEAVPDNPF